MLHFARDSLLAFPVAIGFFLVGGLHLYSPDVLTTNWFDQRLAPGFKPNKGTGRPRVLPREPTGRARLEAFNALRRTDISPLTDTRHVTQTIPAWYPADPYLGHPPIPGPFETMYECTLGDPKYKSAPIPVGPNLFQYQTFPESERFTTEHRSSYTNPATRPLPFEPNWYGSLAIPDKDRETENEQQQKRASADFQHVPQQGCVHKYSLPLEEQEKNMIPSDRLVPTSTLGTPPAFFRY